jgi:hypothetical protein
MRATWVANIPFSWVRYTRRPSSFLLRLEGDEDLRSMISFRHDVHHPAEYR